MANAAADETKSLVESKSLPESKSRVKDSGRKQVSGQASRVESNGSKRRVESKSGTIKDYHVHVYYDPATTRDRALRLREGVAAQFPQARLGRWHDELVGPHPQSMYQIAFPSGLLAALVPWLMLNRDGLTVLLHPETGDDYTDHSAHAAWFGAVLPLRLEVFGKRK